MYGLKKFLKEPAVQREFSQSKIFRQISRASDSERWDSRKPETNWNTISLSCSYKNKTIALGREELLKRVWGEEYLGESRTVDVHIGQLRKKLELYDEIKTIPKLGYRLED